MRRILLSALAPPAFLFYNKYNPNFCSSLSIATIRSDPKARGDKKKNSPPFASPQKAGEGASRDRDRDTKEGR
jgi:hypothetical protein